MHKLQDMVKKFVCHRQTNDQTQKSSQVNQVIW